MKKQKKSENAITLVTLVITVIVLLILAGISIVTLTQTNLLKNAKEVKKLTENAQNTENKTLESYENIIIDLNSRENQKHTYTETILFDGDATSGSIKFLNNYSVNEFDSLVFVYSMINDNGYKTIQEREYKTSTYIFAMQKGDKNCKFVLELNGLQIRRIGITNLQESGFFIGENEDYHLLQVKGIKY